jgi:hypothetical protein
MEQTLEEAALKYASEKLQRVVIPCKELNANVAEYVGFINGAKWQQKRSYSEEDVREMLFMALYEPKEECCTTHTKDSIVRKILKTFKSE